MKQPTDEKDQSKKNLYALLIGIDEYNEEISDLKGCVNDVQQFSQYLESRSAYYNIEEKKLLNKDATKKKIIDEFENHLSQAKENDIVCCFFAGHGIQEKTSVSVFKESEVGDHFESFVCYDSNPFKQESGKNTCLADKEIRYLIHKLAQKKPHILLVFDSCHSGGNTRGAKARNADSKVAQIRSWENFCFHEEISLVDAMKASSLNEILPEGAHVQFSACHDTEVATERSINGEKRGIFTHTLLTILNDSPEDITYNSLRTQLITKMRIWGVDKKQTPQCYGSSTNPHILFRSFLSGKMQKKPRHTTISYDSSGQWCMELGAIHGIRPKRKVKIWRDKNHISFFEASIEEIHPGYSILSIPKAESKKIDTKKSYDSEVNIPIQFPISIFIHASNKEKKEIQSALEVFLENDQNNAFSFANSEDLANYALHSKENKFIISQTFDQRPLIQPIKRSIPDAIEILFLYFLQIAKWESIRNSYSEETYLHDHPTESYYKYPIELKVFQQNKETKEPEEIPIHRGSISIPLESREKKESIRFQLTNHSDKKLYCSLIYLSMAFGAVPRLFPEYRVAIEPGDNVNHNQGKFMKVSLADYIYDYEWEESLDYIKLIISTEDFDPLSMALKELPVPSNISRSYNSGYDTSETEFYPDEEDWSCWNLEFKVQNPNLTTKKA